MTWNILYETHGASWNIYYFSMKLSVFIANLLILLFFKDPFTIPANPFIQFLSNITAKKLQLTSAVLKKWNRVILLRKIWRLERIFVFEPSMHQSRVSIDVN